LLTDDALRDALHARTLSRQDILLVVLAVDADAPKQVKSIRASAQGAGFPEASKWNISETLKRAGSLAIRLPDGWILTAAGRKHVDGLGVVPAKKSIAPKIVAQVAQLRAEIARTSNSDTRAFVEEAITALEVGLFRSSVVLSWAGAMSLLYDNVMSSCLADFNAEAKRRDSKWKNAKIKDDLGRMKESDFLDVVGSPPISMISKNLKEELKTNCLSLRNACGHPSSPRIGENRVSAHLEILILNLFVPMS